MRILHILYKYITALLFHGAIVLLAASLSVVLLFGNSQVVKDILIESDIYTSFVPAVIRENANNTSQQASSVPFNDPAIATIAAQSFDPLSMKLRAETVIDSFYSWLEGASSSVTFSVTFNDQRDLFIDKLSIYAAERLQSLPLCGSRDVTQTNIFQLDCRPDNVPATFIVETVRKDLQNTDFLKDMTYDQESLPRNTNGRFLTEQFHYIPTLYQLVSGGVWFFSALVLVTAVLFIHARRPLRKGMKLLGRDILSNGITLAAVTLFFGFVLPKFTNSFNISGTETSTVFNRLIDRFVNRLDVLVLNIAIVLVSVGLVIIAIERLSRSDSRYDSLHKKSGLVSGYKKMSLPSKGNRSRPPIQTSENAGVKKSISRKNKNYRKIDM